MDETAKFFMDISKLVFGGVILAGIMKEGFDPGILYGIGVGSTVAAYFASIILYYISNR